MHLKMGRFGKIHRLHQRRVKNTRKILRNGEWHHRNRFVPLPELPCENQMLISCCVTVLPVCSLAANTFPKSRETRAPTGGRSFIASATACRKNCVIWPMRHSRIAGNKTMVCFSRKTKQQYVSSEKDGKATGWSAFYVDGKWVEGKK
ncbi:hypothetical protein ACLK19_08685 [Escherichia coli]